MQVSVLNSHFVDCRFPSDFRLTSSFSVCRMSVPRSTCSYQLPWNSHDLYILYAACTTSFSLVPRSTCDQQLPSDHVSRLMHSITVILRSWIWHGVLSFVSYIGMTSTIVLQSMPSGLWLTYQFKRNIHSILVIPCQNSHHWNSHSNFHWFF